MTRTRVQILDLGSHLVKALVGEVNGHGEIRVVALDALPVPPCDDDGPFPSGLESVLADLAGRALTRSQPVHIVAGEGLVRSELRRHAGAAQRPGPELVRVSRACFLQSCGTPEQVITVSSLPWSCSQDAELTEMAVAHAYVPWLDLQALESLLGRARLRLGGLFSRLHALGELGRRWVGREAPDAECVAVLDTGFSSTCLLGFSKGVWTGAGLSFAGAGDIGTGDWDPNQDLPPRPALERYFKSVSIALGRLGTGRGRAAAEDEEVLPIPCRIDRIAFTGGMAQLPGFVAAARESLGFPCILIDPAILSELPRRLPALPVGMFGVAIGALAVMGHQDTAHLDLWRDHVSSTRESAPVRPDRLRWVPLATLALLVTLLVFGTIKSEWAAVNLRIAALESKRQALAAEAPAVHTLRASMLRYHAARSREAVLDTRAQYLRQLLSFHPDWNRVSDRLARALPRDGMAVPALGITVHWPGARTFGTEGGTEEKVVEVRLSVEATEPLLVRDLVTNLKTSKLMSQVSLDEHALGRTGESGGHTVKDHYQFTISGRLGQGEHEVR